MAIVRLALLLGIGLIAFPAAFAQESGDSGDESWQFGYMQYMWFPDVPAVINVNQTQVAGLPEDVGTVLEALNFALMAEFEARKGRWWFYISPMFYDGDDDFSFTGLAGAQRPFTVAESAWLVDAGVAYDLLGDKFWSGKENSFTIAPFAGLFYFRDNIRIRVPPGPIDNGLILKEVVEVGSPIAGIKARAQLSERFALRFSGHYGVFNDSKLDSNRQVILMLQYDFKRRTVPANAFFGYRYTHVRLEDGSYDVHFDAKGPFLGVGFRW